MRISDWSSDVCSSDLVRAGYLVSDNTLLYARGGYENVRASVRLTDAAGTRRDKDSFDGWTIGGGVERAILHNVTARLESRYRDLGSGGTKFERHQALFGVAYRSEGHTSELQSLMRNSYPVFCS